MCGGGYNTDFDGFFQSGFPGCETSVGSIGIVPFDSIAYIIGKHCDTIHFSYIFFQSPALYMQGGVTGSPPLAINKYIGVYLF